MTRPNIVVIQADQMAAQALGAYGDTAAHTPEIDQLADQGALFERAYCNTPLCAPSRASMMTGRMPSEIDCCDNGDDFPASVPTFAHRLRQEGYHTALIGRMHFIGPDQHHGFEERLTTDVYPADLDMVPDWERPLEDRLQWYHDADAVFAAGVSQASVQQDFDDEVSWRSLRHLNDRVRVNQEAGHQVPFLMVTSFIHPHDPYEPPREHWDRFDGVAIPGPQHPDPPHPDQDPHTHRLRIMSGFDQRTPGTEQIARTRRAYYAAVSYIDDCIGRIRRRLEELHLSENTVIIVTSDHGDMLGEKGLWYKMSPYEQSSRVPLIITGPQASVPRGRFSNPVSLVDLMPTLLEISGAAEPGAPVTDAAGISLLESIRREQSVQAGPADRDVVIEYLAEGTYAPQLTLVRGRHKLIICPGDLDQLFDLMADPQEVENLAAEPAQSELVAQLRAALLSRYSMDDLDQQIRTSQRRRQLVSSALAQGKTRHWDFAPDPERRYVRGDFWSSLEYGTIPDRSR
ncbi:choline-sulfatase [Nesterenkonia haasae]|uniref:choline-sulfatase n=1 Tax=Nesterenkonia haasae TaxID=2587813 RepID=UPI001390FEA0|nr:choline-sulfatase [Nesterenkonia haasae]NDK30860.1 choline-sulfatase [Nesterenkonia haasae]